MSTTTETTNSADMLNAAELIARSVAAFANISGMIAENKSREQDGLAMAYRAESFTAVEYDLLQHLKDLNL